MVCPGEYFEWAQSLLQDALLVFGRGVCVDIILSPNKPQIGNLNGILKAVKSFPCYIILRIVEKETGERVTQSLKGVYRSPVTPNTLVSGMRK